MKRTEELVPVFKALGDPTRLKILELLRSRGKSCCDLIAREERGLCACDIEKAVGLSQAAVSHHMDLLRRAGLVKPRSAGAGCTTGGTKPRSPASRRPWRRRSKKN